MKYARLTKEQLEALHPEFSNFLALQSIDKKEWDDIKARQPHVAEQEIDVFSDMIWDNVLSKAEFLDNISPQHLFLFRCGDSQLHSLIVSSKNTEVDFRTKEGTAWLSDNLDDESVDILTGNKAYEADRNAEIFELIRKGAQLSDGTLYRAIDAILRG